MITTTKDLPTQYITVTPGPGAREARLGRLERLLAQARVTVQGLEAEAAEARAPFEAESTSAHEELRDAQSVQEDLQADIDEKLEEQAALEEQIRALQIQRDRVLARITDLAARKPGAAGRIEAARRGVEAQEQLVNRAGARVRKRLMPVRQRVESLERRIKILKQYMGLPT